MTLLTVLRFPATILAVVPEEQPDQYQTKQYREDDLRRDEGIQCAGHTELFVAGLFREPINFDRMPSSENPGGSDELVSRPLVPQSGLLKAPMTELASGDKPFDRKSFIIR